MVAIIAIVAAIAIPSLLHSKIAAHEVAAIGDLREIVRGRGGVGEPIVCPPAPYRFYETKSGYVRGCTNGVFWATPAVAGKTGVRGFGTDVSQRICYTKDGSIPNLAGNCTVIE